MVFCVPCLPSFSPIFPLSSWNQAQGPAYSELQWTSTIALNSPQALKPTLVCFEAGSHIPHTGLWAPYPSVSPSWIPGLQTRTATPDFSCLFLCGNGDKASSIDKHSWDQLSHISSLSLVLLGFFVFFFCSHFSLYHARNIGYLSLFITLWTDVQHIYQVSPSLSFIPVTYRVLNMVLESTTSYFCCFSTCSNLDICDSQLPQTIGVYITLIVFMV